jgi:hypothetical protein
MEKADYLGLYAKGWGDGDLSVVLQSLADEYVMDDPNSGRISKADFSGYFTGFKDQMDPIRDKSRPFMEVGEVLTQEAEGVLTAWVWWSIPGTPVQGSGLIKVGETGVSSERLAFYTKLPE